MLGYRIEPSRGEALIEVRTDRTRDSEDREDNEREVQDPQQSIPIEDTLIPATLLAWGCPL